MVESELGNCGPRRRIIPEGDDRVRLTCPECGYIAYENPKLVVGSVGVWDSQILLCRRAIPPRKGYWTLPAGYLELNETTEHGAKREAWEEARAQIELESLLAIYNVQKISQVQIIYRAHLLNPEIASGPESSEVALFQWSEIPWDIIAFPTVRWALQQYHSVRDRSLFPVGSNLEEEPWI